MKNCIPLLGVFFCLTLLNNCTNRSDENDLDIKKTLKNEQVTSKSDQEFTEPTKPTKPTNPDPPKDGDDWLI
jgi:hypothetical protein